MNTARPALAAAGGSPTQDKEPLRRRLKLRHLLFLLLLLSGIIPLALLGGRLIADYQGILKDQETVLLTNSAQALADDLSEDLARYKEQLHLLGMGLTARPEQRPLDALLRDPWVERHLRGFLDRRPEIVALNLVDREGRGRQSRTRTLNDRVEREMVDVFDRLREGERGLYRFVVLSERQEPAVVVGVTVGDEQAETGWLAMQALVEVSVRLPTVRAQDDPDAEEVFLIDRDGAFLWSGGRRAETAQVELALRKSDLVPDFTRQLSLTRAYDLEIDGRTVSTLARVIPVDETGWGVVVHKPAALAFQEVQRLLTRVLFATLVLVAMALVFALFAARTLSRPIQRLAKTTHEIATGHFDRRVDTSGLGFEIAELADDFNRMSEYVAAYIERLQRAVKANRALFINTIRAFAAVIDAKDPYTRGHSERVAAYSRAIAVYLGVPKDVQEQVWVSAVLHDVGKIGVEDRILKKGSVLTPEEFAQMQQHPVIGADIVTPIAELEKMLPGIRWHHEAWNGSGYPDGLRGDDIPLMARIIGVADTFDAITTNRPYQQAYTADYALQTIEKLAGSKFDPKIVTAFLLAFKAGHIAKAREQAENVTSSSGSMQMSPVALEMS